MPDLYKSKFLSNITQCKNKLNISVTHIVLYKIPVGSKHTFTETAIKVFSKAVVHDMCISIKDDKQNVNDIVTGFITKLNAVEKLFECKRKESKKADLI